MSNSVGVGHLTPGFADPVFDSHNVFRTVMRATAYAGRGLRVEPPLTAPSPLNDATAGLCLSLGDFETPLWLGETTADLVPALSWLRFHCSVPIVENAQAARFALVLDVGGLPRLSTFHSGEFAYPDRSTTLVVQVPSLTDGPGTTWSGPGIKGSIRVGIAGLPEWFWGDWALNGELYPMGVDVFFTSGDAIVGLPRTIQVET